MAGKKILVLTVGVLLVFLTIIGYLVGYENLWSIWKIPPMSMSFSDLRNLLGGAESIAHGYDPLYYNPYDPWNRPLNQPRLVQYILGFIKPNQGDAVFGGVIFGALFFSGVLIAFKKLNRTSAVIIALLAFSPVAALGIERGNHDLLIFFLVALSLAVIDRAWISMLILLTASFIKLFPVFAILCLWRFNDRKSIIVSGTFLALFVSYMIYNKADLPQVFNSTQKGFYYWAYGAMSYDINATPFSYIPLAAIIIGTTMLYISNLRNQKHKPSDIVYLSAFKAGAGIYLGTFLLGNSWAYRLIFLIFIVPQLLAWIKTDRSRQLVATVALIVTIISCCPTWINSGILDEVANWLLFIALWYLMLSVLPPFMQVGSLDSSSNYRS
jgi:hypothetical protein